MRALDYANPQHSFIETFQGGDEHTATQDGMLIGSIARNSSTSGVKGYIKINNTEINIPVGLVSVSLPISKGDNIYIYTYGSYYIYLFNYI